MICFFPAQSRISGSIAALHVEDLRAGTGVDNLSQDFTDSSAQSSSALIWWERDSHTFLLFHTIAIGFEHRLNMELDLQSLFGLYSLVPRNFLPPLPYLGSNTRALLVSQDRRHLFVTPWIWGNAVGACCSGQSCLQNSHSNTPYTVYC